MQTTIEVGANAEERAIAYLRSKGYRIVERNWKCRVGELDVVAYEGDVLCIVEVRSRKNDRYGKAIEMITPRKQRQVTRAAMVYVTYRRPNERRVRFDAVAITGDEILLVRNAWLA